MSELHSLEQLYPIYTLRILLLLDTIPKSRSSVTKFYQFYFFLNFSYQQDERYEAVRTYSSFIVPYWYLEIRLFAEQ
jgi:hypothetical protein